MCTAGATIRMVSSATEPGPAAASPFALTVRPNRGWTWRSGSMRSNRRREVKSLEGDQGDQLRKHIADNEIQTRRIEWESPNPRNEKCWLGECHWSDHMMRASRLVGLAMLARIS